MLHVIVERHVVCLGRGSCTDAVRMVSESLQSPIDSINGDRLTREAGQDISVDSRWSSYKEPESEDNKVG